MAKLAFRLLIFLLLPLVLTECALRVASPKLEGALRLVDFFAPVRSTAANSGLDALFIGSSRTAAAIDPSSFSAAMTTTARINQFIVANAGKGYSTPAARYFGIRRLIAENPDVFRDKTLLVECAGGIPGMDRWDRDWGRGWPELLGPNLEWRDIVRMWKVMDGGIAKKLRITSSKYLLTVRLWANIRSMPAKLVAASLPSTPSGPTVDLATLGGIRNDQEGVEIARQQMERVVEEQSWDQESVSGWDETIVANTIHMVQQAGGRVVFFTLPQSTSDMAEFQTPIRRVDREKFELWREKNSLPLIGCSQIEVTDADFPDMLHIRRSLSPDISTCLAEALQLVTSPVQ